MVKSELNRASVAVLALGHGVTDLYANFLAALLPVFESSFHLSKTLIGVMVFIVGVSGSLFQVVFGYLGDKWGRRLFLVPGPALAGIFMCLIGLSPSFVILIFLLLIGGMGVSAFHPHAASAAGDMAGDKRDIGLSVFMTVGTVGYATGPMVAVALMSSVGPAGMPSASIAGIATSILLYKYAIPEERQTRTRNSVSVLKVIRPQLKPLAILCAIVVLRSTATIVFGNFLSLLAKQRGLSLMVGGSILFLFSLSTALGTFFGGHISSRMSRKKMLMYSLLLSSPLLLALIHANGAWFVILLILSGAMLSCSNPVNLAIAQELIPESASTASSIMMGLGWGIAAIFAMVFGVLADLFGGDVVPAMSIAASLPVFATITAIPLPRK